MAEATRISGALVLIAAVLAAVPAAAPAAETAEVAVFDATTGQWRLRHASGAVSSFYFGIPGDTPLLGDWNCDGLDTVAMYRQSDGFIYLRNVNAQGTADSEFFFGLADDIPLAGDWDGDGCDTFAIYRPSEGRVYVRNRLGTGVADHSYYYGVPGDQPFAGDFDGDGRSGVGLYRESSGFAYFRNSLTSGPAEFEFFYGAPSDRIVAGDWDRDGDDTVGIFRPDEARFYLSNENRQGYAAMEFQFGEPGSVPVAGRLGAAATASGPPTEDLVRWSDPATWGGTLPAAGTEVTIPTGRAVLLDVSPPPLAGLRIEGTLVFDERDLSLTSDWILVSRGELFIGSAADPFDHEAVITLTGQRGGDIAGMGTRGIVSMGGRLELHGAPVAPAWTRLAATAPAGATQITLEQPVAWRPGDRIVIASTDFDFEQAEERTITAVSGSQVSFAEPLENEHWGRLQSYDGGVLDERAEVALLDRNIVIQGAADSVSSNFGGHLMAMPGSVVHIENTEFFRMGQEGVMGRYPIHFHRAGDQAGSYVRNNAIHHSFNRCVTVHGTHNTEVTGNVAHETLGHCFFLEDGIERGNVFVSNLGLGTREPDSPLLPSDAGYPGPATFWISNPDNVFRDNVAAGSDGIGFWMALSENPTGPSATGAVWPRRTPLGEFSGNVAHSNASDGLHVDRGARADGSTEVTYYRPVINPHDPDSTPVTAEFVDLTAYKNRNRGAWLRGDNLALVGATLADNSVGASFAADDSAMRDTLVVGESANMGNPRSWEETGPAGRSLPKPWDAGFTIRGFDFYDGLVGVETSHFAGFASRSQRRAAALSYEDFTHYTIDPRNYATGLTFAPDTNRVYLATRAVPADPDKGEDGYRSAVFQDADGSVTGTVGATVTVNNPFVYDGSCSFRSDWNSRICNRPYASLYLSNRSDDPAEIAPVTVTRSDGASHTMLGHPESGPNDRFRTSLLAGDTYAIGLGGSRPDHFQVGLQYATEGNSLRVAVADVTGPVYIYRDWWIDSRNLLREVSSLAALDAGTGDSYYRDGDTLYLRLVFQEDRDWAAIDVCTRPGC